MGNDLRSCLIRIFVFMYPRKLLTLLLLVGLLSISPALKLTFADPDFTPTGRLRADNNYVKGISQGSYAWDFTVGFNVTGNDCWILISGSYGDFYGYYWNGTQWVSNSSLVSGLSIGTYRSTPNMAFNVTGDGNWTLISGDQYGEWHGFYWNGTQWVADSSRVTGLTITGSGNSNPEMTFNFTGDGNWTLISGEYYGNFYGWYWNGSQWVSKSSLVTGLGTLPPQGRSSPTIGFNVSRIRQDKWILISGQYYGNQYGFYWNGTQWIQDSSLVAGASKLGSTLSYPCLSYNFSGDNRWVLMITHSYTQVSGFYYGDLHLNLKLLDNKGNAIKNGYATIFNGSYYSKYSSDTGWANFTGITVLPINVEVNFQEVTVNITTINSNAQEDFNVACLVYALTINTKWISDQAIGNVELQLYRNGTSLNGVYDLPLNPITNDSGMFTWEQLAYQTGSYTVTALWASNTTALTQDTTLTIIIPPPYRHKPPPTPPPEPHEIITEWWTTLTPEQKTITIIGGFSVLVLIGLLFKSVSLKIK